MHPQAHHSAFQQPFRFYRFRCIGKLLNAGRCAFMQPIAVAGLSVTATQLKTGLSDQVPWGGELLQIERDPKRKNWESGARQAHAYGMLRVATKGSVVKESRGRVRSFRQKYPCVRSASKLFLPSPCKTLSFHCRRTVQTVGCKSRHACIDLGIYPQSESPPVCTMASTFAGGSSTSGQQGSMLGFGPAAGNAPYYGSGGVGGGGGGSGGEQQSQRLQYYQSPQHASAPATQKIEGRRAGKVKFFDTQKVRSLRSSRGDTPAFAARGTDGSCHAHSRVSASSTTTAQKSLATKKVSLLELFNCDPCLKVASSAVFVHYTSITAKSGFRSLAEGEEVIVRPYCFVAVWLMPCQAEYEIVRGPKGFQAANVTGPAGAQVLGDNRRQMCAITCFR